MESPSAAAAPPTWTRRLANAPAARIAGGLALGQCAVYATTPVLSRLFTPEQVGRSSVFLALAATAGGLATARLEVQLPGADDAQAAWLVRVAVRVLVVVSLLAGLCYALFEGPVPGLLLALTCAGVASAALATQWGARLHRLDGVAFSKATQGLLQSLAQVALGGAGIKALGLQWGYAVAYVGSAATQLVSLRHHRPARAARHSADARATWTRAGTTTLATALNLLTTNIPLWVLAHRFSEADAGQFSIAQRLAVVPSALAVAALTPPITAQIGQALRGSAPTWPIVRRWLLRLAVPAAVLNLVLVVLPRGWFSAALGPEWATTKDYVVLLAPMMFGNLVVGPLSQILATIGHHRRQLAWDATRLTAMLTTVGACLSMHASARVTVGALSVCMVVFYALYVLLLMPERARRTGRTRPSTSPRSLPVTLGALGLLAMLTGTLLLRHTPMIGVGLLAAAIVVFGLFAVPLELLVVSWAALLPVWSLGSIPPTLFDATRVLLGLVIGVRSLANGARARVAPGVGVMLLLASFTLVAATLHHDGRDTTLAVTMFASVLVAALVVTQVPRLKPLFVGYALGCCASALVIIAASLDVAPLSGLTPNLHPGLERLTGLSSSSPKVSSELGLAVLITFHLRRTARGKGRAWWSFACMVCFLGLLLCGGRTGLAMVVLAAVVHVLRTGLRPVHVGLGLLGGLMLYLAQRGGTHLNTLTRLVRPSESDTPTGFSSGRTELNGAAWHALLDHPLTGLGTTSFVDSVGGMPHFPPLLFAVAGGVLPATLCVVMTLWLASQVVDGAFDTRPQMDLVALLLTGMLGYALLEPTGPWVGTEMAVLLLATTALLHAATERPPRGPRRRARPPLTPEKDRDVTDSRRLRQPVRGPLPATGDDLPRPRSRIANPQHRRGRPDAGSDSLG